MLQLWQGLFVFHLPRQQRELLQRKSITDHRNRIESVESYYVIEVLTTMLDPYIEPKVQAELLFEYHKGFC